MLRLSKLADYAVVVLVRLSRGEVVQTAPGIAAATGVPEPTVAKVLKVLSGAGLVVSRRGARGGYRLARPLRDISVAEAITAIDGPIALTACVEGSGCGCEATASCPVHGKWSPVNDAVRAALGAITLADLDANFPRARPPVQPVPVQPPVAAPSPSIPAAE